MPRHGRVYYTQSVTLYVVLALENMALSSDTILLFFIRKFVAFCDFRGIDTSAQRVYKELRPPASQPAKKLAKPACSLRESMPGLYAADAAALDVIS